MIIEVLDDEYYVRKKIQQTLEWSALDITHIVSYNSATMALTHIDKDNPDILLVDINMPHMDGLTFIREATLRLPKVTCIIISGYDDFAYVKKALQYGVKDYLLKPIKKDELIELLNRIILEKKSETLRLVLDKKREKQAKMYFLNHLLFEESKETSQYIQKSLEEFKSPLCLIKELSVCVGISDQRSTTSNKEIDPSNKKVIEILEMAIEKHPHEIFLDNEKRIVLIIASHQIDIKKKINQYIRILSIKQGLSFSFGVSSPVKNLTKIPQGYKEAVDALSKKVVWDKKKVITQEENPTFSYDKFYITRDIKTSLILGLRKQDYPYIEGIFATMLEDLKRLQIRGDFLKTIAIHLIEPCLTVIEEEGVDNNPELLNIYVGAYDDLLSLNDIFSLFNYIKSIYSRCCHREGETTQGVHVAIRKTLNYIRVHYTNPALSIDTISEEIAINYHYLCTLFRKSLGKTINEYILDYRMSKALELINTGNYNISEIAENVGFSSMSYFTRCFKKKFSVPPSKFRIK